MRSNEYKYSSTSSRKRMTSSVFNASEDPNLFVINVKLPPQIFPLQVPGTQDPGRDILRAGNSYLAG